MSRVTSPPAVARRLLAAVPAGAAGRRLVALALVDAVGTGSFLSISAIFLTRAVGLSVPQVGFGLAMGAAVGLLSSVPLGMVADRYGARNVLVVAYLWRAAGFTAYAFVADFASFVAVVVAMGLLDKVLGPLAQALVGVTVPEEQRVRTMAYMGAVRNVGFGVGALLGGLALLFDNRWSYASMILLNAATFVLMAVIVIRMPLVRGATGRPVRRSISFAVFTDRPYLTLAMLNAVLTLHMTLLGVGIPVWVSTQTMVPRVFVSAVLLLNTILAVLFQVRASRGAETLPGAATLLRRGGLSLAACCCLLMLLPSVPVPVAVAVLMLGVVALTMGELFQSAGGWGVSYTLARAGSESSYLTLFWLGAGAQQIFAPLLVAAVIGAGSWAWLVVAAGLGAAGLAVPAVASWAARARAPVTQPVPP